MNNIFTIVKKEFIDILRDRKTLMMTFLVPILILPFVFYFSMSASMNMMNVDETKVYPIALNSDSETLKDLFKQTNYFEITDQLGNDAIEAVYQDDIIAYIDIPDHYEEALTRGENPTIDLYYDVSSTSSEAAVMVIQELLGQYKKNITASILTSLSVSPSLLEDIPFEVHYKDDDSNPISMMILGMMVPMLIIGYSASGITPIATDLGAGEKERGTLEPLLTTKSKRSHIFIAKLIVTSIFGAITSILSIIGVMVSLHFVSSELIDLSMSLQTILAISLLTILYVIFISALQLMVSTYAKSIKEANTYLTPLSLLPIMLSIFTMYMEVKDATTWLFHIPILNTVLVVKEAILNQMNMSHLMITIAWSIVYVIASVMISKHFYTKEEVIFRS